MKNTSEVRFSEPGNPQGDTTSSKPVGLGRFMGHMAGTLAIFILCGGVASAQGDSPTQLRQFIDGQLLDAHRMLDFESAEIQKVPAFVKLFRDAFPEEAAQADAANNMDLLIYDNTVLRATPTCSAPRRCGSSGAAGSSSIMAHSQL